MWSEKVRHLVAATNLTPTFKYGEFSLTSFRRATSGFGACGTKIQKWVFLCIFCWEKLASQSFET
jgi:hypothetical protein